MTHIFLRRAGLVLLLFVSFGTIRATAGPVYLQLVIDPPKTAGASIPTVPRANSSGSFSVTSNKSGIGSFHIYALDDSTGSFGLSYFNIGLIGTVSNVFNRSPIGSFDTVDDNGDSVVPFGAAGFSEGLIRSGVGINPRTPIAGLQAIGSPYRIGGLGQTASNFNNTPNMLAVPPGGSRLWAGVTSGQWGNYATDPSSSVGGKSWLFLGEGNYTGNRPAIDLGAATTALYYSSADFNSQDTATIRNYDGSIQVEIDNVNANDPGVVTYDLSRYYPGPPPNQFWPLGYDPPDGTSGGSPSMIQPATLDPITNEFRWITTGAALGKYSWHSAYLAPNQTDSIHVDISIRITAVPEPATISLLGFALAALCVPGCARVSRPRTAPRSVNPCRL